ncbi:S1C family serine protease [Allostreptomyces psammosilenae]|uniref:Putative serine protease PepD n=1 Tax=Allostreptomyces psammosilenae TaxID=1892865 RepID=A0A852ZSX6_9ACTN|nr:trypsin-like peptidase domain-containing protein [Allostreptomyces psammosilenae]NYI05503.1 putative serine protease PepD [Allostreptomyces psammosilenae]
MTSHEEHALGAGPAKSPAAQETATAHAPSQNASPSQHASAGQHAGQHASAGQNPGAGPGTGAGQSQGPEAAAGPAGATGVHAPQSPAPAHHGHAPQPAPAGTATTQAFPTLGHAHAAAPGGQGASAYHPGQPGQPGHGQPGYPQQPPQYPYGGPPAQPPGVGHPGFPPGPGGPAAGDRGRRRGVVGLVAATAILAAAIGGGVGAFVGERDSGSTGTSLSAPLDPEAVNRAPDSIAGIAQAALPGTVTISATGGNEAGTGTGFVYDTAGNILTNNHVVAPAADGGELNVVFSDGSSHPASIVGRAPGYDVAVIRLDDPEGVDLQPLQLGNSDEVVVGDTAIAIGAPFGLSGTVTSGIVSAKDRPVASGSSDGSQASYMNALQTDASINPGNSGGPLLDASGRVIGVNSAIRSTGGGSPFGQEEAGSIGLGFAIPINQAKWVADQLIEDGTAEYANLGVLYNQQYSGVGAQIMPQEVQGQEPVTPGGPADEAGLEPGDVITRMDDSAIDSGPTLVSEIWSHKPGDQVEVTYIRDGETHTTTVTLGSRNADADS